TWNDRHATTNAYATDPSNGLGINMAARTQDIPFYLCPSDPSEMRRPADWVDNGNNDPSRYPEGRLSYLAWNGTTSSFVPTIPNRTTWDARAGIFAVTGPSNQVLKGVAILAVSDGTSNTAL